MSITAPFQIDRNTLRIETEHTHMHTHTHACAHTHTCTHRHAHSWHERYTLGKDSFLDVTAGSVGPVHLTGADTFVLIVIQCYRLVQTDWCPYHLCLDVLEELLAPSIEQMNTPLVKDPYCLALAFAPISLTIE